MKEHRPVITLVAGRDVAGRRIAGVEKAAAVGQPGQRAGPGPRDLVGDVAHAQHRFLAAVLGHAVGQQRAVLRRKPPVQRARPVGGQRVDVDQHTVGAGHAVAHVQHRLVLLAVAPGVEIAPRPRLPRPPPQHRRPQRADLEQRPQPVFNGRARRHGVQRGVGQRVFAIGPGAHLGRVGVLQPPVRIGDVDAMDAFDQRLTAGGDGRFFGGGHDRPRYGQGHPAEMPTAGADQGADHRPGFGPALAGAAVEVGTGVAARAGSWPRIDCTIASTSLGFSASTSRC